jgi:hypothetical protein
MPYWDDALLDFEKDDLNKRSKKGTLSLVVHRGNMIYEHVYECVVCPLCRSDLTAENAVKIEATNEQGAFLGAFLTSLDHQGKLLPDDEGMLEGGYHASSQCSKCGFFIDDLEI